MNSAALTQVLNLIESLWGAETKDRAVGLLGAAERIWENLTGVPLEVKSFSETVTFSNGRCVTSAHPVKQVSSITALPEGVALDTLRVQPFGLITLVYPYCGEAVVEYSAGFDSTIPDDIALALAHLTVWLLNADIVDSIQSEVRVDFNQLPPIARQVISAWRN
jgi:hypothetical protein